MHRIIVTAALGVASLLVEHAHAGDRLLATGGVAQIEGSAGGGLTPWALIAGLGTGGQVGASGYCTRVSPEDFDLDACGLAVGVRNRVELSLARQRFDLGTTVPGQSIKQTIVGVKLRVLGDAVIDQDRWYPQLALGLQYKKNHDFDFVPALLGARRDADIDVYATASKVYLAGPFGRTWLGSLTLRATRANQLGILGFGGDRNDGYTLVGEGSVGTFLADSLVLGAEYRQKPDALSAFREDDFYDVFLAWFPVKQLSVTAAYVDLGNIADKPDQQASYLSLQFAW